MIIQTDADGTIYKGNLLVSLGWVYLRYLLKKEKYLQFFDRLIKLPVFYFLSYIPQYTYLAFLPFKGCPFELASEVKNPVKKKWISEIERLKPEKIIVISHQEKTILGKFIKNTPELKNYNFEIISNSAQIEDGKFTGKSEIKINLYTKYKFVDKNFFFLGDMRDYLFYGRKAEKFILISRLRLDFLFHGKGT